MGRGFWRFLHYFIFYLYFFILKAPLFPWFFLFFHSFSFCFCLFFLKKREEKDLLCQLYSLLIPVESQMKLGLSVINAWQKSLEGLKSKKAKDKAKKITDILKFQNEFHYPDKEIENFIKDLIAIHQSSQPLQRLKHLQRKLKVEQSFRIKSRRAPPSNSHSIQYFKPFLLWTFDLDNRSLWESVHSSYFSIISFFLHWSFMDY